MVALAQCLGLMDTTARFNLESKHVFWTHNPVAKVLYEMLQRLVDIDVLLIRDEPDKQYKWNQNFLGTWESALSEKSDGGDSYRAKPAVKREQFLRVLDKSKSRSPKKGDEVK